VHRVLHAISVSVAVVATSAALAQAQCTGDCNRNLHVDVAELTRGVLMALGGTDICVRMFDRTGDGVVRIGDLIQGVQNALDGCHLCPPITTVYTAPCVMSTGGARCDAPSGDAGLFLGPWIIESTGANLRLTQEGVDPPVVYYASVKTDQLAHIDGIPSGSGVEHPTTGVVSFYPGRDNESMQIDNLLPQLLTIGSAEDGTCSVVGWFGGF
jgi:hypothetical protein